jgi:hypothetical protein
VHVQHVLELPKQLVGWAASRPSRSGCAMLALIGHLMLSLRELSLGGCQSVYKRRSVHRTRYHVQDSRSAVQ